MDFIVHQKIVPAVNQIETHPFHQQIETQKFLQENKVQIESWGPFAEGKNNIFHNKVLASIAAKYQKTVAQVILRWLTQRGVVAIPKSVRKERILANQWFVEVMMLQSWSERLKMNDRNATRG